MLSHFINVFEVWLILRLMHLPASLAAGFVVEAVTKVINGAFFFVPTRAGVYESGNALTLGAIGLGTSAGVALAIIRKLRAFVWVAYGMGAIAVIAFKDRQPDFGFWILDFGGRMRRARKRLFNPKSKI